MTDVFDLARFVAAQNRAGTYEQALGELRAGRKHSHWMWFVFPQLAGLGRSQIAQQFAISGLAEARAYRSHPVLGSRLVACTRALLALDETDPEAVLGGIDATKLRSSMTLFERADPATEEFAAVLEQYFAGRRDDLTLTLLG